MSDELIHSLLDVQSDDELDDAIEMLLDSLGLEHDYDFDESKHPRDEKGRWIDSEGVLQGPDTNGPNATGGTSAGGQRQLPGVPRAAPALPDIRNQEKTHLATGTITDTSSLGGGANETLRLTIETPDGDLDAVFKPADGERDGLRNSVPSGEYYLREAAASDIATELGLGDIVPPVALREIDGRVGSVHEYRNDTLTVARDVYEDPMDLIQGGNGHTTHEEIGRIAAFDYVIGNTDRHLGNWLIDEGAGQVTLIDHGLSLPTNNEDDYIRSNFGATARQDGYDVGSIIGDSWDNKWPKIEGILDQYGLSRAVQRAAKERFDNLIETKNNGGSFEDLRFSMEN